MDFLNITNMDFLTEYIKYLKDNNYKSLAERIENNSLSIDEATVEIVNSNYRIKTYNSFAKAKRITKLTG